MTNEHCRKCGNRTSIGNDPIGLDQGSTISFCSNQTCKARDEAPGSIWSAPSTHTGVPGPIEQPQSSTGPVEAPPRNCPKCGAAMIGEARPKADIGPSYYYLCRPCNYGFTTAMVNSGRPLTMQERRLASIDSKKLIDKAKKTQALHKELFPPEGTPQIREELSHLFPYPTPEEIAAKSKPAKPVEEVLEKARSLRRTIHKMEDERRAEEKREYDERVKPLMKVVKELNLKERREKARARPIHAKYGANGRIEGIPDKTKR